MLEESSNDELDWAKDLGGNKPDPLPQWAIDNGFEPTGRSCTRCHGELLERRKIAYKNINNSYILVRCENYDEGGCSFEHEVSPSYE